MCEDMLAEHVHWIWLFFLRLEDQNGDKLDVSLANEGVSLPLLLCAGFTYDFLSDNVSWRAGA